MPQYVFPIAGPCNYADTHWDSNGNGRADLAVDIFAAEGTPIVALIGGRGEFVRYPNGGDTYTLYGDDGLTYYHAHCVAGSVRPSGRVEQGQQIGRVGRTGNAANTPPHVHWARATRAYGIDQYGQGDLEPWAFLRRVQAQQTEEDPMRIQELETALAQAEAERDSFKADLATANSTIGAVAAHIITPTVAEMQAERAKPSSKRRWMDRSATWVERLQPHVVTGGE